MKFKIHWAKLHSWITLPILPVLLICQHKPRAPLKVRCPRWGNQGDLPRALSGFFEWASEGWNALSRWGLLLPVIHSVTERLFVKLTWDPVRRELKGTIHCFCHHSVPRFGPNWLLEPLFQDSVRLCHSSPWAPCIPPPPSASLLASSSSFSCPPGSGPSHVGAVHVTHWGQGTLSVTVFPSCFPPSGLWGFSMRPK